MNPEDALRRALHEEAGPLPAPRPEALHAIAAGAARRRLRRLSGVAAACTVVVAAIVFAETRGGDGGPDTNVATRPAQPAATTTTMPAGATSEPDGPPDFAVALSAKGRVVVLDGSTSRALRVLGQYPVEGGRMLRGISLTPDRSVAYFGYGGSSGACENAVYRAPVDGGRPPEKVVEGSTPKLSPDGRLLAYAAAGSRFGVTGFLHACSNVLVVRELATGTERAWLPSPNDNYFSVGGISSITWAPDSKRLAFAFAYEETGVYLVDSLDRGGRLEDLEPLPGDGELFAPSWRPDGKIVVGSVCCQPEYDEPRKRFLIDPDTRSAVPFAGVEHFSFLDFDRTGRHLLYVKAGEEGELFRRSDGGEPVFMARDFLEADW